MTTSTIFNTLDNLLTTESYLGTKFQEYIANKDWDMAATTKAEWDTVKASRETLLTNLENNYQTDLDSIGTARGDLQDLLTLGNLMDSNLETYEDQIDTVKNSSINKLRMAEINTYYSERYKAHTAIMKIIVFLCIPLLLLAILSKREFISDSVARFLGIIIIVVAIIWVGTKMLDLSRRSNMVYSEYDTPGTGEVGLPVLLEKDIHDLAEKESFIMGQPRHIGSSLANGYTKTYMSDYFENYGNNKNYYSYN